MRTIIIKTGPRGPKGDTGEQGPPGQSGDVAVNALVTTSSFGEFTASIDSKVDSLTTATSSYIIASQTSSFVTNSETGSFVSNSQTSSMTVLTSSFAISSSFISDTFISASAVRSGFGGGGGIASVPAGTVSSSAQLAISISGSFTAPSASFSTRVTSLEAGSGQTSGLVSSSAQLATEISGAFGSSSSSLASRTTTLEANPVFSETGISGSWQGQNFISASQVATNLPTGIVSGSAQISYTSITDVPSSIISGSTQITSFGFVSQSGGIVDLPNVKIQYANVYNNFSDLPDATNYHGMFAHVHNLGKAVYAHAGEWVELANISITSSIDDLNAATSSFLTSLPAGIVSSSTFPFTGDAVITGSLIVSGSFNAFRVVSTNLVLGTQAGENLNSGATGNVILGNQAGMEGSGNTDNNVFIGDSAGEDITGISRYNVFLGLSAGNQGTGKTDNVGIGYNALGGRAGSDSSDGNVAIGYSAGQSSLSTRYTVAIGYNAVAGNAGSGFSGYGNIGIGRDAISNLGTSGGAYNTAIGYYAGATISSGDANIVIGSGSKGEAAMSNQLRIGHSNTILISGSLTDGGLKILGQVSASSYIGDGSGLTGVGSAAGTVSSSAQLATPISGAFAAPSASFSTRVTNNTSNISTNTSNISSLTNVTGSYASTGSVILQDLTISNLSGSLIPGDGSTISYAVTVVDSGGDKFAIDLGSGAQTTPDFSLIAGNTYRFTQDDGSNNNHPFGFYDISADSNYTTGVTYNGTAGQAGSYAQIVVTNSTPILKYRCTVHGIVMGGDAIISITTGSQIENGFLTVSGSTILTGSVDIFGDTTIAGNVTASGFTVSASAFVGDGTNLNLASNSTIPSSDAFPFTGSAIVSGSLNITGSFSVTSDAGQMLQLNNDGTFTLGDGATVTSTNSTAIGTGAQAGGNATAYGNYANGGTGGVSIGSYSSATNVYGIALGYDADSLASHAISIGPGINNSGANSIILHSKAYNNTVVNSDPKAFKIFMSNNTTPDLVISASNESRLSGSSFVIENSGSTLFEVIGSEGTIFSLEDDLDGTLFTVNDRSGIPMFEVSASGRIVAEEGESVIRSQRPIVTVATNPFTASAANVGQYFRVGGDITCSIFTTASVACPIGAEFDFFQTSSAGNLLFETASGVTLNSKNGNLNLAGQFSSATLKRVGIDEWDLMGDLT